MTDVISSSDTVEHRFYSVMNEQGKYFSGFNPEKSAADFVDDVLASKLFTNKYEIKLRPNERLVEINVALSMDNVKISEPFRPRFRPKQEH